MDTQKKIDRAFARWAELDDNARNERDQKKADKALDRLSKMFHNEADFYKYYASKIKSTFIVK